MAGLHGPFPTQEGDRNKYYGAAVAYLLIAANTIRLHVSAANATAVAAALAAWNTAWGIAETPATRTVITVADKHTADLNMMHILRLIYHDIPVAAITATDTAALHITVRDTHGTAAAAPTTFPVATVDTNTKLTHTIAFKDEKTVSGHAKPAGARGCEIWEKIGDPKPASMSELTYVGTATKTPFVNSFVLGQGGLNVYYWLRWVNDSGEHGPWGPEENGTIRS